MSESTSADKKQTRSPEEIQADIEETRERLVRNLEQLKAETKPRALMEKARQSLSGVFVDHETGAVRADRVAMVAGAVVGLIVLRRGLKARARRKELRQLAEVVWVPVPRHGLSPAYSTVARNAAELGPAPVAVAELTAS